MNALKEYVVVQYGYGQLRIHDREYYLRYNNEGNAWKILATFNKDDEYKEPVSAGRWRPAVMFDKTPFFTYYARMGPDKCSGYFSPHGNFIFHSNLYEPVMEEGLRELEIFDESAASPAGDGLPDKIKHLLADLQKNEDRFNTEEKIRASKAGEALEELRKIIIH